MGLAGVFLSGLLCMLSTFIHGANAEAHATFYEPDSGGACGYKDNLLKQQYGSNNAALSTALFNKGQACGACLQIWCQNDLKWCKPGSVIVTATNFCPPNASKPNNNGGWCNPPLQHFDLSRPAFEKIAVYRAGIVPVGFKRVPCQRQGGIRISIGGNSFLYLFLFSNVGGAGDIQAVSVRGSRSGWAPMMRNWGQNWQSASSLAGQSLSFAITTSDRRSVLAHNIIPGNLGVGQTYISRVQF